MTVSQSGAIGLHQQQQQGFGFASSGFNQQASSSVLSLPVCHLPFPPSDEEIYTDISVTQFLRFCETNFVVINRFFICKVSAKTVADVWCSLCTVVVNFDLPHDMAHTRTVTADSAAIVVSLGLW